MSSYECTQCHGTGKFPATSVPSLPFDINVNSDIKGGYADFGTNSITSHPADRRSNSCDRLTILMKDQNNAPETSSKGGSNLLKRPGFKESNVAPTAGRKHSLNPMNISNKLAGIVGSGTKILRRHTTYIRNPRGPAVTEDSGKNCVSGHVHTWHKNQVSPF